MSVLIKRMILQLGISFILFHSLFHVFFSLFLFILTQDYFSPTSFCRYAVEIKKREKEKREVEPNQYMQERQTEISHVLTRSAS